MGKIFFDKDYFEGKGSNYKAYKNMEKVIKNLYIPLVMREDIKSQDRILDIGCALGYFLKYFDEHGLKTYGLDISEFAIREAKKLTNAELLIHDINNGLIFKDNSFDLITMIDVIEHLYSPYNLLLETKRILRKNGKLIIATPNIQSVERRYKKRWHGFTDITHIYLFDTVSLKFLVNRAGFDVIKIITPFHPFYRLPIIFQKIIEKTSLGGQIWLVARKTL